MKKEKQNENGVKITWDEMIFEVFVVFLCIMHTSTINAMNITRVFKVNNSAELNFPKKFCCFFVGGINLHMKKRHMFMHCYAISAEEARTPNFVKLIENYCSSGICWENYTVCIWFQWIEWKIKLIIIMELKKISTRFNRVSNIFFYTGLKVYKSWWMKWSEYRNWNYIKVWKKRFSKLFKSDSQSEFNRKRIFFRLFFFFPYSLKCG